MKKVSLTGKSIFGKQLMATVSVMIVLLILGIFACIAVGARNFSDTLKSRMGFTVVMNDDVSDEQLASVKRMLSGARYVNEVTFTSADETLAAWE
ncbi:MAG: permease-like cell division protein FtsX, partial [Muribaculaceae bacterium]|nr:permease-like cell division protein FtsX [Muribaculaceae bacterium]